MEEIDAFKSSFRSEIVVVLTGVPGLHMIFAPVKSLPLMRTYHVSLSVSPSGAYMQRVRK